MQTRIAFATVSGTRRARHMDLPVSYGVSWDVCVQAVLAAAIILSSAVPAARLFAAIGNSLSVIVREIPGAGMGPEQTVRMLHGKVDFQLPLINGFSATIPAS